MRLLVLIIGLALAGAVKAQDMKPLTPEERRVIVDKGTEAPFSGRYYKPVSYTHLRAHET